MAKAARFRVDPKLAALLGEGYRSSELALKELIDNSWDADATVVHVTLPGPMSGSDIVIEDNGTGMTEQELRADYLAIASDRASRKGAMTIQRNRPVKGRKGIGKFAGLMAADTMTVATRCRGTCTHIAIRKEDLQSGSGDLESIDLPVTTTRCMPDETGTTITMSGLSQAFDPPSAEKLSPLLMLEYGRQEDFKLFVNGEAIGVDDIPGQVFEHTDEIPGLGPLRLQFAISDGKKSLRQSGIAVRVTGKVIGKPTTFGLDDDEEIPPKLLKRVYGELEANGLANDITADWGAVIENSTAYLMVSGWAAVHLKRALSTTFGNEIQLARARLALKVARTLEHLPEYRRPFAEQRIERVLTNLYGEKEDRIEAVVSVALDAIEQDEYYIVVKEVHDAPAEDIARLATALGQFGLVDMAMMASQAQHRLEILDRIDALVASPATREQDIHVALENNLWVLGTEYSLLASNKTLRRVIEQYTTAKYTGARAAGRPDILMLSGVSGRNVIIEFKRPSLDITREHEAQAITYRDELLPQFPEGIDVLLIGRGWAPRSDRTFVPGGLSVTSYNAIISRARSELEWLLARITADSDT